MVQKHLRIQRTKTTMHKFKFFIKNKNMKSIILAVLFAITSFGVFAQKIDKAKDLLKNNKLDQAKTEVDNFLAVEKNQSNSEAWYIKAKVYSAIAKDSTLKSTVPNSREVTFDALKKYIELE